MNRIGIGLVGTGYMGKSHALAYHSLRTVFGADRPQPELVALCDVPLPKAQDFAKAFGFARATDNWRTLLDDPAIDLISITTPNKFHAEMAIAALKAGKHVWCEKPMALTLADAEAMTEAARASDRQTCLGYNYRANPAYIHAKRLIADGAIGELTHVRGWMDEDYLADAGLLWSWRATRAEAGLGTLGDMMCHIVSLVTGLAGPIAELTADTRTVFETRPKPEGGEGRVENEDIATALLRFASGVPGTLASSRTVWGRKNSLVWEVHGTTGTLLFDQERLNELRLYEAGDPAKAGFRTILTGPAHPPYGAFCPAPGHQLGFNEMKAIELDNFLTRIGGGQADVVDFAEGLEIERVIHAMDRSAAERRWITL